MKHYHTDVTAHPEKGYGIDELRYRRAYLLAKCEMAKIQMSEQMTHFKDGFKQPTGLMGKVINSLSYVDYALIAFRLGQRLFQWRKHHKTR